jgi:hypothetical protein
MKQKHNISFISQIKILLLAVLAVGGFFFSSLSNNELKKVDYAVEQTQDDSREANEPVLYFANYEAIVPILSVNINLDYFTIQEPTILKEILHVDLPKVLTQNDNFFITLFRYIISTKAP